MKTLIIVLVFAFGHQTFAQEVLLSEEPEVPGMVDGKGLEEFNRISQADGIESVTLLTIGNASDILTSHHFNVQIGGVAHQFHTKGYTRTGKDGVIWQGTIGDHTDLYTLAYIDGYLAGRIFLDGELVTLRPISTEFSAAVKRKKDFKRKPDGWGERKDEEPLELSNKTMSGSDNIDIMVVYTSAAATGIGSIITSGISDLQTSLNYSGTDVDVTEVHTAQVSYTSTEDIELDTDRLKHPSDGYMDNVHDLRNDYGADVVVLVITDDTTGFNGWAYDLGTPASEAFATVIKDDILDDLLIAHEVGHLIGGEHDLQSTGDESEGPFTWAHGFVNKTGTSFETVMSIDLDPGSFRQAMFSTPDKSYLGVTIGTAVDEDVGRAWEEQADDFAGYRATTTGPLSVSISGPTALAWGVEDDVTANPTGGTGSYSYKWWWRVQGTSSWNDPLVSTQTYSFTMVWEDGVEFKVEVDSGNSTESEDTHEVDYIGGAKTNHEEEIKEVSLARSYPNPATGQVQFQYYLENETEIDFGIYDLLGRRVATIDNGVKQAGVTQISHDINRLSAGAYWYVLRANDAVISKMMTVAK